MCIILVKLFPMKSTLKLRAERLPTPVTFLPLKYRVEDIEALASKPREEGERRRRRLA